MNISSLETHFESGATVTLEACVEAGVLRSARDPLKVLGEGSLTKKLTVKAHKFSKSAIQKINQAGGQAEEVGLPVEDKSE